MNIQAYIESGILENYCMGLLPESEERDVLLMSKTYKAVYDEIKNIQTTLENFAKIQAVEPTREVRIATFNKLYKLEAGEGKMYPPFIEKRTSFDEIKAWVDEQTLDEPGPDFGPAHMQPLQGDEYVTSFLAWVTEGHPPETHADYNEYIVVLRGACTMLFDGKPEHFSQGDIITIPPYVEHQAIVTSEKPMLGLVQRQIF